MPFDCSPLRSKIFRFVVQIKWLSSCACCGRCGLFVVWPEKGERESSLYSTGNKYRSIVVVGLWKKKFSTVPVGAVRYYVVVVSCNLRSRNWGKG